MIRALAVASAALLGCGRSPSIDLFFPNQEASDATARLRIEAREPDGDCASFAEQVASGELPLGGGSKSAEVSFPSGEVEILDVPEGRRTIYAWAFADRARDTPPFLAGCTDRYDSTGESGEAEGVALLLEHIPYPTLTIRRESGDRQVGRPGETLPRPVAVRAEATVDGNIIPIPGLEVVFRTGGPFTLGSGTTEHVARTDAAGIARTSVALPTEAGTGSVLATSPLIDNLEVNFTVTALDELPLALRSIDVDFPGSPVALAAGSIAGDAVLIALGSLDDETRLMVATDPMTTPTLLPITGELGVSPVGVATIGDRIAIANARIASRENAEVRILRATSGTIELEEAHVLTGSNAVGLTAITRMGETALAIATTGRSVDEQSCPEAGCSCPANEICNGMGVCVAHDGEVLVLAPDPTRPGKLAEENRCDRPVSTCSTAGCCLTADVGCEPDDCGCQVPQRARLGSLQAPLDPRAIAAASLRSSASSELLVATSAGLHRLDPSAGGHRDTGVFVLTPDAIAVIGASMDVRLDPNVDLLWIEDGPCEGGASIDALCPVAGDVTGATGCLGLLLTEQSGPVPELDPPRVGSCRRHPLSFAPGAICVAQLDDDTQPDVVISAPGGGSIQVFAGDGNGGLLHPPQSFEAAGGPIACGDLDGDGLDEIAIADPSRPGRFHFLSF